MGEGEVIRSMRGRSGSVETKSSNDRMRAHDEIGIPFKDAGAVQERFGS